MMGIRQYITNVLKVPICPQTFLNADSTNIKSIRSDLLYRRSTIHEDLLVNIPHFFFFFQLCWILVINEAFATTATTTQAG